MNHRIGFVACAAILVTSLAGANGDEEVPAADPNRPISAVAGRPLPFPVKDEAQAVAPPLTGAKALPVEPAELSLGSFANGAKYDTTLGSSIEEFQSLVIRQSKIERGKVTLPVASVALLIEARPGVSPLGQDALYFPGKPKILVDYDQTIVVRKDLTIALGESAVVGSSVVRYAAALPLAGTLGAGITTESLSGNTWSTETGTGAFEVSLTQPGWRPKVFHEGLQQGRVDEVTPKQVKLGWFSSVRTDTLIFADKLEKGTKQKAGEETTLPTGKIKVTGVTQARTVTLETPDGNKTLTAPPDPKVLSEDTEARKKCIVLGKDYAVVLNPNLSDFTKGEAQLFVYSGIHVYKIGEAFDSATDYRVWPNVLPTGLVIGLMIANDKPIELDEKKNTLEGPDGSFKIITTWADGELASFRVEKGDARTPEVPAKGRSSIDLMLGGGPTIASLGARMKKAAVSEPRAPGDAGAPAPAASTPAPPAEASFKDNPVAFARPHLFWTLGGAVFGFVLAALFGMTRKRRPREPWE